MSAPFAGRPEASRGVHAYTENGTNPMLPAALSPKAEWYLKESNSYDFELAKVAMGKFGTNEDIAPTAIFLASDESNFVTGQTIGVEGGATMLGGAAR